MPPLSPANGTINNTNGGTPTPIEQRRTDAGLQDMKIAVGNLVEMEGLGEQCRAIGLAADAYKCGI
jgi:hypothetical protein